jgi:hypothetical protein
VVPVHDCAGPHEVVDEACSQPLAPLHRPVLPHGEPAATVHWPDGAVVPAASGVHGPGEVALQGWQVPHPQLPQQTLFTQLPLMHSLPAPHAVPFGFSAQLRFGGVPWQVYGARQCESIAQLVRQVVPPHRYGLQLDEVAAEHAPVPLQCEIGVYVEPVHDSVPHDTVVAASWQPAAPLQKPVLPQGGLAAQRFIGSAWPSGTLAQLPALAPTLHDVHSEHPLLTQQTPSTQNRPVKHSLVAAHAWPGRLRLPQRLVFGSQM